VDNSTNTWQAYIIWSHRKHIQNKLDQSASRISPGRHSFTVAKQIRHWGLDGRKRRSREHLLWPRPVRMDVGVGDAQRQPLLSRSYMAHKRGHTSLLHLWIESNKGREKMGTQWENDLDMASLLIPSQLRHGRGSCWPTSSATMKRRSRKRISVALPQPSAQPPTASRAAGPSPPPRAIPWPGRCRLLEPPRVVPDSRTMSNRPQI
jgi:hypothetical protein